MNQKLMQILKKSQAIMETVESGNYSKGNVDQSLIDGSLVTEDVEKAPIKQPNIKNTAPVINSNVDDDYEQYVENSNLPPMIKEAMKKERIPIPEMSFGSFELEDVAPLIKKGTKPTVQEKKQSIRENTSVENQVVNRLANNQKLKASIDEETIRKIVREEMESIIEDYFDKRVIKEEIQIKVGNTIFSGNLSPLPSKQTQKKK